MFIDASVIVAILKPEADAEEQMARLDTAGGPFYVSPMVRMEASLSLARAKAEAVDAKGKPTPEILRQSGAAVDQLIEALAAQDIPISSEIGMAARDVAARYGKLVGHRAKLNLGDCFTYACAASVGQKIAYKGDDFIHTDMG
ncbi:type II toxin-antitoxin system VapC family toxin [Aliirhizobium terrae]|uniref:type II toxin-antitoxin system VapC family toxin n=1 Tax=Terrirhizobium terrae TaxID=2926709 RepID=UPI0025790B0B|nr:type II toxin-antitoxin system VapC family toxin [Rhizobium sp. CC-CFT758]WJH40473.1 type II toxin-antitoxin system VapC family toxin [Rhizobium sp. CC-CFT758]